MAENKEAYVDNSCSSSASVSKETDRESRSMDRQTPPDACSTPPQHLAGAGAIYSAFSDAKVSKVQPSKRTTSESPQQAQDMTSATLDGPCRKLADRKSHSRTGSENSELEAALQVDHPKTNWKTPPPRAISPIEFEDRSPESPLGSIENSNKSSGTGSGRSSNVKGWRDDIKSRLTPPSSGSARSRSANDKKKKSSNWYSVLSPTYKSRTEDFKKLFKDVPSGERLIVDYSCALQKDILVHGRLYVTQNWLCFYANIFRWETVITIRCKDIQAITKEKTARVIPNAIQIMSDREKYFFTSFATRDKSFLMLFRVWQNALMDQPMLAQELWQWVHYCYGDELGLTSSDEDYVRPSQEEAASIQATLGLVLPEADEDEQEQDDLADSSFTGDPPLIGLPHFPGMNASTDDIIPQGAAAAEPKRRKPMPPNSLPVPSPDATSGDLPTDMGDTTDDSDGGGEVYCGNHEHQGTTSVDNVFNASVDQLFEILFCPSAFMETIRREEKTFDINVPPWPDEPNESGNKVRDLTYTITSNFSFGPKHIPSTEKQILHAESQPGVRYVVDCECVQLGIPYGDSFYVFNRYCLTKVSKSRTRLRVTSDIRYKKSVWGLVKSIIVKNCNTGLTSYFQHLEQNLLKELDKAVQPAAMTQGSRKKMLRRRRNPSDRASATKWQAEQHGSSAQGSPAKSAATKDEWQIEINMDMVVRIMFVGMLVLMVINAVLFYKFFSLEKKASILQYQARREPWLSPSGCNSPPDAQDSWSGSHTEHKFKPLNAETWKEVLETNIQLIDQMKKTLTFLYNNLDIPQQPPNQPDSKD